MKSGIFSFFLLIATLVVTAAVATYADVTMAQNSGSAQAQANAPQPLKQVEPQYVCMVTNKLYDKSQIPVVVGDKTYYGCCQMCEAKLKEDPASRMATDPVSGKEVDKSTTVIGAAPDGQVYYFESVEDLTAYGKTANQ